MNTIIIGDELAQQLALDLNLPYIEVEDRTFTDGEVQPRLAKEVKADKAILLIQKKAEENVNAYLVRYYLLAKKLKTEVPYLISIMPYLPYARQDEIFRPGEPLSSKYIDALIQNTADLFLTCNMHEHRTKIGQLFSIPAYNIFLFRDLATQFSDYDIKNTVVLGPDGESGAFVDDFCKTFPATKLVFHKERNVDTGEIKFILPDNLKPEEYQGKDFILVDDIVSTGHTILGAAKIAQGWGAKSISFAFIHPIFGDKTISQLKQINPRKIVCPNTLENSINSIHISDSIAKFIKDNNILEHDKN